MPQGGEETDRGSRASSVDGSPEHYSSAPAFNHPDVEAGERFQNIPQWAGGNTNGSLGYRYHRKTQINWSAGGLSPSLLRAVPLCHDATAS